LITPTWFETAEGKLCELDELGTGADPVGRSSKIERRDEKLSGRVVGKVERFVEENTRKTRKI
jgi:hypothetical protein